MLVSFGISLAGADGGKEEKMQKKSIVKEKSFEFALMIVRLYKKLCFEKEYTLSKQLLRSGTSIGANVNEALAGESRADFIHKMSVASKEARESLYWLELLRDSQIINYDYGEEIYNCVELIKMLTRIVKTSQKT